MSLVKLTKTDLKTLDDQADKMNRVDQQLVDVRKKAIFQALSTATNARINMIQNTQKWLGEMEKKIFNPAFINDLDPAKTIALFKYINNLNLKALAETDRLEVVLNSYIQSGAMELSAENNKDNAKTADIRKLKGDIMERISSVLKSNMSDAVVVNADTKQKEDTEEVDNKDTQDNSVNLEDDKKAEKESVDDLDLRLSKIDLS